MGSRTSAPQPLPDKAGYGDLGHGVLALQIAEHVNTL